MNRSKLSMGSKAAGNLGVFVIFVFALFAGTRPERLGDKVARSSPSRSASVALAGWRAPA